MVPSLTSSLSLVVYLIALPRPHFPDFVPRAVLPARLLPAAAKSRRSVPFVREQLRAVQLPA